MQQLLKFTRRFALPLWRWYLAGIVALAVTNIITLEIPQLAKHIINTVDAGKVEGDLKYYAIALIALGVVTIFIRALSRIFLFWPGRKLEASSRNFLFDRMMMMAQSFYERFGMGDLISRLTNDIGQLRAFYAFGVLQALNLGFLTIFTISKMLSVHVTLTIACLAPLIMMVFFMKRVFSRLHVLSLASQTALGNLSNRVTEAFVNIHVIKANAAESSFLDKSTTESQTVYKTNIDAVVLRTVFFPLLNSLMNLSQVFVVFYGGYEVIHGRLSIGDILAFNVYLAFLSFPLSAFGIIVSLYQRCSAALSRIADIEDTEVEQGTDHVGTLDRAPVLEVSHLNFSYQLSKSDERPFGLHDISFKLSPGKRIGIFGAIGSGKSSLFNLLTRLLDLPKGMVFIDNKDVATLDPQELRNHIGYVQQSVHLFSDSVEDNIRLGKPSASHEDVQRAAEQAQVRRDIESFEDSWKTGIGEKGLRLSGGQKQRIALARQLIRQTPILLLDDVLSAVDQKTERRMIAELKALKSSIILASHRTLVLQECDEVLFMEDGRITDRGSFAELKQRHPAAFEQEATKHE